MIFRKLPRSRHGNQFDLNAHEITVFLDGDPILRPISLSRVFMLSAYREKIKIRIFLKIFLYSKSVKERLKES